MNLRPSGYEPLEENSRVLPTTAESPTKKGGISPILWEKLELSGFSWFQATFQRSVRELYHLKCSTILGTILQQIYYKAPCASNTIISQN